MFKMECVSQIIIMLIFKLTLVILCRDSLKLKLCRWKAAQGKYSLRISKYSLWSKINLGLNFTSNLFWRYNVKKRKRTLHCWFLEPWNREKKSYTHLTTFFTSTWWMDCKNIKKKFFSRWLFEIIHIIRFEIWDLEIWKIFWDMILTI